MKSPCIRTQPLSLLWHSQQECISALWKAVRTRRADLFLPSPLSFFRSFFLSFFQSFSFFKKIQRRQWWGCLCLCLLHFPVRRALHFLCMLTATISTTIVHQRPTECYARNTRPSYRESGIDGRALEVAGDTSGRAGKVRKKRRGKKKNTQPHRHYSNRWTLKGCHAPSYRYVGCLGISSISSRVELAAS